MEGPGRTPRGFGAGPAGDRSSEGASNATEGGDGADHPARRAELEGEPHGRRRALRDLATKPVDRLVEDTHEKETELRRAVGALDLTALGLGAIIGTGIFVIIGEAITTSGPSIILAFVLAGVTCAFSALAFAELASSIPVSGSAYTDSYATLGELAA